MAKVQARQKQQEKKFYYAKKKKIKIKIWDVGVNNTVISKLIETKNTSKYLIAYLDEVIRPLALILPKMSKYVKPFNEKNMSLYVDDEKLLEKYKTIWIKLKT